MPCMVIIVYILNAGVSLPDHGEDRDHAESQKLMSMVTDQNHLLY